jgi:hypothetical protein
MNGASLSWLLYGRLSAAIGDKHTMAGVFMQRMCRRVFSMLGTLALITISGSSPAAFALA